MNSNDFRNEKLNNRKILLEEKLRMSGEEARLEGHLRQRLIESGWKELVKSHCKELIRKKGNDKLNLDELVEEITVKGKALIPSEIKEEILQRIQIYFESQGLI